MDIEESRVFKHLLDPFTWEWRRELDNKNVARGTTIELDLND